MDWITFKPNGMFYSFFATQSEGRLSSQLAHTNEIDDAATELKRQIDVQAKRMKLALQKRPADIFAKPDS